MVKRLIIRGVPPVQSFVVCRQTFHVLLITASDIYCYYNRHASNAAFISAALW